MSRPLRIKVLVKIHGAHMGESKSLSFARDYVFWSSVTAQIKEKLKSCKIYKKIFGRFGIPGEVVSNNRSQESIQ